MTPRFLLWLIIILTILSIWINLPSLNNLADEIVVFNKKISLSFLKTNDLKLNIRGKSIDISFLTPRKLTDKFPMKLGLDLQGGTQLTLQTDMSKIDPKERDSALESARQVIEKRVNLYGVSESTVQSSKLGEERRILVELPGVKDMQTATSLVGKTAQLEFREMLATSSAEASASGFVATGITGKDLKKASVVFGQSKNTAGPEVAIEFTGEGATKFAEVTKRNVGKPLAIFIDNMPISAPTVQQEIIGGNATISGQFTVEEAKNLSIQLNAGALPVPIKILAQRQISATLGGVSVEKSLIAGVIGILSVMLFMVAYYGVYGLVAGLALLIYTVFVLAIFRTGLFILPQITLTLAGIAGFILSIGMAVDANILTFERMKEEFRSGKVGKQALEIGFTRAWTSIRDSNVSSLITAAILYTFGTSVVRGFALTLAIGVLVSMFSALTITRTFLRLMPRFRK